MKTEIVSPYVFWEKMKSFRFFRISELQGAIGDTLFITTDAPEDVDGLIGGAIASIRESLKLGKA